MATVTSLLTRILDAEGAPTIENIVGGPGATTNVDAFVQGAQSIARRQSAQTDHGMYEVRGTAVDVSGAGVHVGVWIQHLNFTVTTMFGVRLASAFADFHRHNYPLANYPIVGGWERLWIDVSRTPEATGGTFNKAALNRVGVVATLPAVGGTSQNIYVDSSDFGSGIALRATGTAGIWQDFVDADQGTSANRYGVVLKREGVIFCLARLGLGSSATSLVFNDSGFVLVFANQTIVATDFMGITVDLQNVATDVDFSNGVIRSASATRQGDIQVVGTAGLFDMTSMTLGNLRTIDLTSACSVFNSRLADSDKLNQNGALLDGCSISGATTLDGEAFVISNSPANIKRCDFTFSDGHAIEITVPGTYTFEGNTFTGYGANDTTDAAIFNNSGGAVTLNITGGGSTPTIRNGVGATTTINNNITVTITVKDEAGTAIQGVRVSVRKVADNTELVGGLTDVNGQVTGTTAANAGAVSVRARKGSGGTDYVPVDSPQTIGTADFSVTVTMVEDSVNTL